MLDKSIIQGESDLVVVQPSAFRRPIVFDSTMKSTPWPASFNSHRLGQVAREVHIKTFHDGEPVSDELQRNDVQDALQAVHRLGNLNLLSLAGLELLIALVANNNRLAAASDDCRGNTLLAVCLKSSCA